MTRVTIDGQGVDVYSDSEARFKNNLTSLKFYAYEGMNYNIHLEQVGIVVVNTPEGRFYYRGNKLINLPEYLADLSRSLQREVVKELLTR